MTAHPIHRIRGVLAGTALALLLVVSHAAAQQPPMPAADRIAELIATGRIAEAWQLGERHLRETGGADAADDPHAILVLARTGRALHYDGLPWRGVDMVETATARSDRLLPPDHPAAIEAHETLADIYAAIARHGEAAEQYRIALAGQRSLSGEDAPETVGLAARLGRTYRLQGQYALAEPLLVGAIEAYEAAPPQPAAPMVESWIELGRLYADQGLAAQAMPLFERALARSEAGTLLLDQERRDLIADLGAAHAEAGDPAEAERLFLRAIGTGEDADPLSPAALGLALLYRGRGDFGRAAPLLRGYVEGWTDAMGATCYFAVTGRHELARLEELRGRPAEAALLYRSAFRDGRTVRGAGHPATALSGWGLVRTVLASSAPPDEAGEALAIARGLTVLLRDRIARGGGARETLVGGGARNRYC